MSGSALITRPTNTAIAWLTRPINNISPPTTGYAVSVPLFLAHVAHVAQILPPQRYIVNVVDNRYLFFVSLCAAICNQQITLLPPNRLTTTQVSLQKRYADSVILCGDDTQTTGDKADIVDLSTVILPSETAHCPLLMPRIQDEQTALICFTSGSTGQPKAIEKTWQTVRQSTQINARYMLADPSRTSYHLAAVPSQHMWGLETTVFMGLHSDTCVVDANTDLPGDILYHSTKLPEPTTLIATPTHLRALAAMPLDTTSTKNASNSLNRILSATAPLDPTLATQLENRFSADLFEVYGCSEVGSMAIKRTKNTSQWCRFDGIHFSNDKNGRTVADANHLSHSTQLEDEIEAVDKQHFLLKGRTSDMIKIAGKRGSLAELNAVLLRFEDLTDGVIFMPEGHTATPRLAAILVTKVSKTTVKDELKAFLREHIDPAFIPRRMLFTDTLPRTENGKLPRKALLALYQKLTQA